MRPRDVDLSYGGPLSRAMIWKLQRDLRVTGLLVPLLLTRHQSVFGNIHNGVALFVSHFHSAELLCDAWHSENDLQGSL